MGDEPMERWMDVLNTSNECPQQLSSTWFLVSSDSAYSVHAWSGYAMNSRQSDNNTQFRFCMERDAFVTSVTESETSSSVKPSLAAKVP